MAKREKQKAKLDYEEERKESESKSSKAVIVLSSSDDEEANEDLSLKIVEKALLMRAGKSTRSYSVLDDPKDNSGVVEISSSSSQEAEVFAAGPSEVRSEAIDKVVSKKRIRKKKKKIEKMETGDETVILVKDEQTVETIKKAEKAGTVEASEIVESMDPNTVEISDNIVLRKLLRGPRYFNPPDSGWERCYNCGEDGHMAVNCASTSKRKKPCFVCGSLDHGAKQCSKSQDCFICKKGGHRSKDCPEKHQSNSQSAKICLKCGASGHDMFSCRNDYPHDDLKEIQCYVCKDFGHLCCVDSVDISPREVSCYKCGQLGHTGLACARLRGETSGAWPPRLCYNCGEEGHFARECRSSSKVGKRNHELSTPTLRFHRGNKEYLGFKSVPHDLSKAHKRKKTQTQYEERGMATPRRSKHRGDWITEDPGDFSNRKPQKNHWITEDPGDFSNGTPQKNRWITEDPGDFSNRTPQKSHWRSPATPSSHRHKISNLTAGGNISSSQSSKKNFHHRFSASRYGNSGSGEIRRNYNWR